MIEVSVKKSFNNRKSFEYRLKSNSSRIVLFGPSGSGKSNLIKMIVGFLNPDEGVIRVNGNTYYEHKKNLPVYKRRVGYLPQEYTLFPHMTVEENILYGVKINKIKLNMNNYYNLLNKLELSDKLDLYPDQLSGGERQRVALMRALIINPNILLFDEPFSSLDKVIKERLRDLVVDIIDETGKKAIFVTHDFEDAFVLGKEVFIVYDGRIIESGTADEIFNNPKFVETAKILNIKNIWQSKELQFLENFKSKSPYVAVKPENIGINPNNSDFTFKAKVKKIRKKGAFEEIEFEVQNLTIFSTHPDSNLKKGDITIIGFSYKDLIFLEEFKF